MVMSSTNQFSYSNITFVRGSLTSDGIRIKSPSSSYNNDCCSYDIDDNDKSSKFCSYNHLSCINNCIPFPNTQRHTHIYVGNQIKIPDNTIIPFSRIIYAKYINVCCGDNPDSTIQNVPQTKKIHRQKNKSTGLIEQTSLLNHHSTTTTNDHRHLNLNYGALNNNKTSFHIELTFVHPLGKDIIPVKLNLLMDLLPNNNDNNHNINNTFDLVSYIIERSYQNVRKEKNILIIINPYGGSGKALKKFNQKIKPILDISPFINYEIAFTEYHQHAIDIAREIDINRFDTIACCSGDGIPNEVINGLYQRQDRAQAFNKICVTQLPCGSGNAMSVSCHWTTNPSYATLCLLKSIESRIDLMCCQQPSYIDNYPRLSFLSQTFGVIAESDINTEFIRWMGPVRFDIGVAFNIFKCKKYPCDLYVKYAAKTKRQLNIHYLHNKSKTQVLLFTPDTSQVSIQPTESPSSSSSSSSSSQNNLQDTDFNLKYSIKDPVPDDWERIDSDITDNLSIFYTGKMPYMAKDAKFFPAALPADGTIDMILTDTRTPLHKITSILLSVEKGTHVRRPEVIHSKVLAYRLVPRIDDSVISVDGEYFPLEPLQVEVIPGLL